MLKDQYLICPAHLLLTLYTSFNFLQLCPRLTCVKLSSTCGILVQLPLESNSQPWYAHLPLGVIEEIEEIEEIWSYSSKMMLEGGGGICSYASWPSQSQKSVCTIPAGLAKSSTEVDRACGPGWPPTNVTQYHEVINLIAQCPIFGAFRDPSVPAASIWSLALCAPLTEEPSDGDTHHSSPTLADRSWNRKFGVGDIYIYLFGISYLINLAKSWSCTMFFLDFGRVYIKCWVSL